MQDAKYAKLQDDQPFTSTLKLEHQFSKTSKEF